jgi:hypothetical protein
MYIDIDTGKYPVSETEIRNTYNNTSFATPFNPPENYKWVLPTIQPTHNNVTQYVIETTPELTQQEIWEQRWSVVDKFQTYTDSFGVTYTKEQQEQEAINKDNQEKEKVLVQSYEAALQNLFDTTAQSKNYDSRITCALRAGYTGPYQQEGVAFAQWMDNCYSYTYQVLQEVSSGIRPQPTVQELLAELPVLTWPTN